MIRAFLIWLKNAKYSQNPSSLKSDTFQFEWFNLYLDPFLIEIMNLATKLLYSTWNTCYTQNREHQERLGNILQMGWFDLYMNWFFKENPDLKREI